MFCLRGSSWRRASFVLLPLMMFVHDENVLLDGNYQKDYPKLIFKGIVTQIISWQIYDHFITSHKTFVFIAVPVVKLLSRKVLFITKRQ